MSTPEVSVDFVPSLRAAYETEHVAQFCDDEDALLAAAEEFIGSTLLTGGCGILVATSDHARELEKRWYAQGLDVLGARQRGLYVTLDAAATLEKLLLDGWPKARRFLSVIEPVVAGCVRRHHPVRVFGEMAGLLCQRGNHAAALHLEDLFNRLGTRYRFATMCAYPVNSCADSAEAHALIKTCSVHTRIVAPEMPAPVRGPADRQVAINELEQKARALEAEVQARIAVERTLERREEALRAADRRKDEFLATLAHELRNPLAPIRNAVEIMRMADADRAATANARQLIERQLKQMARLIDDLLDVSRITQGRLEMRKERMNLAVALQMALETSRPLIESKQHHLEICGPRDPLFVHGDATRLAQVFGNLLNNSAKYSRPQSTIRVALRAEDERAVVTVSDTGAGIPAEILPRVFDMFERADPGPEATQDGLGIGLTLVKRLVELHGGTVQASSDGPERGSTFIVSLPLWRSAAGEEPAASHATIASHAHEATVHRVLVVDDNKDAATSLAMMLAMDGHEVRRAYDGIEALEVAEEFQPEVVLLDIGMPRLDGYGAARELRKRPWGKDTLLVAVTGWGSQEDKRRTAAAGFDRHLVKPVEPEVMRRLVEELRL